MEWYKAKGRLREFIGGTPKRQVWIYVVSQFENKAPYKVGMATDLEKRMGNYQTLFINFWCYQFISTEYAQVLPIERYLQRNMPDGARIRFPAEVKQGRFSEWFNVTRRQIDVAIARLVKEPALTAVAAYRVTPQGIERRAELEQSVGGPMRTRSGREVKQRHGHSMPINNQMFEGISYKQVPNASNTSYPALAEGRAPASHAATALLHKLVLVTASQRERWEGVWPARVTRLLPNDRVRVDFVGENRFDNVRASQVRLLTAELREAARQGAGVGLTKALDDAVPPTTGGAEDEEPQFYPHEHALIAQQFAAYRAAYAAAGAGAAAESAAGSAADAAVAAPPGPRLSIGPYRRAQQFHPRLQAAGLPCGLLSATARRRYHLPEDLQPPGRGR
jgi:hypothetical protein